MDAYTWALVGPGIRPIPPTSRGAVENLIWEYKIHLEKLGHKAFIINTTNRRKIADVLNRRQPDIVHLHISPYTKAVGKTSVPVKILTDHDPAVDSSAYFHLSFFHFLKNNFFYAALTEIGVGNIFSLVDSSKIFVAPNGINTDKFRFRATPIHHDRSIYLAVITPRKRQHLVQEVASIDFVGPLLPSIFPYDEFDETRGNYLGEWTRERLYKHLSDYANLVLLSKREAMPLVVTEALACGLGVVVSEACTAHLDVSLPWVSVIPEDKIKDLEFVEAEIARNRAISLRRRKQIRAYAVDNFSWEKLVPRYAKTCIQLHAHAGKSGARTISRAKLARYYFLCHVPINFRHVAKLLWRKCTHPRELRYSLAIRLRRLLS